MKKKKIDLRADFLRCPILLSDIDTGKVFTGIEVIDNDLIIKELNYKIGNKFNDYYEIESHDQPCWFNKEQEIKDKDLMLDLTNQLINRLNEINDGSYEVIDNITKIFKDL